MTEETAIRIAEALEGIDKSIGLTTLWVIVFGLVLLVYAIVERLR